MRRSISWMDSVFGVVVETSIKPFVRQAQATVGLRPRGGGELGHGGKLRSRLARLRMGPEHARAQSDCAQEDARAERPILHRLLLGLGVDLRAHEDDDVRAVRAALELHARVRAPLARKRRMKP